MSVPLRRPRSVERRNGSVLATGLLLGAIAVLGCTPSTPTPSAASPTTLPPTAAPTLAPPPSPSPSSPAPETFVWAARPDVFPGEEGASFVNVAAGGAGIVALSARVNEGSPTTQLWGSADGMTWQSIKATGLPDRVYISGLWGAAGLYWLRGSLPDSDDPGTLYRSSDGLSWRPSRAMKSDFYDLSVVDGCDSSTVARSACPVFLTGTKDVDGVIWRSTDGGDTWAKATVADATGWRGTQDASPVGILGVIATGEGLLAFGNGVANASDHGGNVQSRFWQSADGGVTWSRVPNAAPLGELYVRDVVAGQNSIAAVGEGMDPSLAVALSSSDGGRTWSQSATSGAKEDGTLRQVFAADGGFLGLGSFGRAGIDNFVRELVWASDDGTSWLTAPAGDLESGFVDDAIQFGDRTIAVGRAWTTEVTGTLEAPFGPAVWARGP